MIAVWGMAVLCLMSAARTLLIASRYVRLFKASRLPASSGYSPLTRVVLCLRGNDPFLRDCISGLLAQDYGNYEIVIVVDAVDDPAWEIAQQAVARSSVPVTIKALRVRSKQRSLLMSSVLEAVDDLPSECEAVVIADADVITAPTWLGSLVAPLENPSVGVATGVRWCVPESGEWGTTVRYLWNAFAEPQRHTHQIPWGGSLAIRRQVLDKARNDRYWRRGFCADITLAPILSACGLRVQVVPEALSSIRETISLWPCLSFLSRQMTWVRLYHPRWPAIFADSLLLTAPTIVGGLCIIWSLAMRESHIAAFALAIGALFSAALCLTHFWVEHHVFNVIRRHGGSTHSPLATWIKCFAVAPLMPLLYSMCALYAHFRRQVSWRGIQYKYRGPWEIEVQVDQPFERLAESATSSMV
ncbi:MAG: glycosyltransferase family 2 protein [Planctomycetaceae bacterium]|nr:glycosyltransferase family 2 protein [Planctomycetales bacterium]MCB9924483.1 glycosyltransferase family 2 protein [Planctomycetaceae bacterium]